MPVALLDVNVLFALAWADHIHHIAAHEWFNTQRLEGWATCPMTQCGFVRISSNPKVTLTPTLPADAILLLSRIIALPGHVFWPDDIGLPLAIAMGPKLTGHLQIADAYLVSLAVHHGGKLATLDKRAASLAAGRNSGAVFVNPTL